MRGGGEQLREFHAVRKGECKLLRVSGHVFPRAAVNDCHLGYAHALCGAGRVHRRVAAADDRNAFPKGKCLRRGFRAAQEVDHVEDVPFYPKHARLFGAEGEHDVFVAFLAQLREGGGGFPADKLRTYRLCECNVLLDGRFGDAEARG